MNNASMPRMGRSVQRPEGRRSGKLREERDRTSVKRSPARLVVAVSSQNDHRDARARCRQMPQEVEAAHSRDPQIEHHAAGVLSMDGLQEGLRGFEDLYSEAHRRQQVPEGPTQRCVVHDGHHPPVVFAHLHSQASVTVGVDPALC